MTEEELSRIYGEDYKPMTPQLREELCYDMINFCLEYCPDIEPIVNWDIMLGRKESKYDKIVKRKVIN